MNGKIEKVWAREVLDSRGNPTVEAEITIGGRHDTAVVKRAPVIVSSMVALVLADLLLRNMSAKLENVKNIYGA